MQRKHVSHEIQTVAFISLSRKLAMTEMATTILATNAVLDKLGKEAAVLVKKYLNNNFDIRLEPDCLFAIEELGIALQRLLGADVANALMQQIQREIENSPIEQE